MLTVNSKNLYYINDATGTYKLLIDTGAGISIFKEHTAKNFKQRFPEKVTIQGITDQKISISESTLVPFIVGNPHKVFIYNLDIEFDGILGLDFLEHYECVIDLKSKELVTNFKKIPLHKVGDEKRVCNEQVIADQPTFSATRKNLLSNIISIEPRTEKICKLTCNLSNVDAVLHMQEKEKVRLPNALVHVNENGEFFTSVVNANAMPKTVDFSNLQIEPFDLSEAIYNFKDRKSVV